MKLFKIIFRKKSSSLNRCIVCNKEIKMTSSNQLFCDSEYCDEQNYAVIDDMYT